MDRALPTRQWILDEYLPAIGWSNASDLLLGEIEKGNEDPDRDAKIRQEFNKEVAFSGSSFTSFWEQQTQNQKPQFVDVVIRRNNDLTMAILIEVKLNIFCPENAAKKAKSIRRNVITDAISQIYSSRNILGETPVEQNYPAYILLPEKIKALYFARYKDITLAGHNEPKNVFIVSPGDAICENRFLCTF